MLVDCRFYLMRLKYKNINCEARYFTPHFGSFVCLTIIKVLRLQRAFISHFLKIFWSSNVMKAFLGAIAQNNRYINILEPRHSHLFLINQYLHHFLCSAWSRLGFETLCLGNWLFQTTKKLSERPKIHFQLQLE